MEITEYEELYYITSCGKVWSYRTNKFLKPTLNKDGYLYITLVNKEGKRVKKKIHRLVAEKFLPNPNNLPEVDHINRCRTDNYLNNLRWVSRAENNDNRKCNKQIICIETGKIYKSQSEAARQLGLDSGNISKVCNGKAKTTGGLTFRFYEEEE